ncbi:hypothetical protein FOL46_005011, partial [Perkinsus olseni]
WASTLMPKPGTKSRKRCQWTIRSWSRHPSELCVSDDKRINVILDSGAARCFARLNFIQHLAKVPGVKLTWEELPKMKGNGVTANGNPMVITHIARLVVWTTRRPHDKVTLRIHCTPQLMPDVLV